MSTVERTLSRRELWTMRWLRFGTSAATAAAITLAGIVRTKWLAHHLEAAGIGVVGQVFASQTWLGVAAALGLAFPLTRAVGAARGAGDADGQRRVVWSALGLVGLAVGVVVTIGLVAASPLAVGLLGSSSYAPLVRFSMLGVAGYALFVTLQGWFAGRSDVRAPFTLAVAGGAAAVLTTLLLVPRFGLAGGVLGAAMFYPAGIAAALIVHWREYAGVLRAPPRPLIARTEVRGMLAVGLGSLVMALGDQGAMLAARVHYVRAFGLEANGHFQAAIALSQQAGAAFYMYLAAYAFGTISGLRDAAGMRDYTRKIWLPVTLVAAAGCATAIVVSGPLLRFFYSAQFDPASRLVGWMLWGEFARVAMQTWALGSLPLGGVRLWLPIVLSTPAALLVAYPAFLALGAGIASLPLAYATAGFATLAVAATRMSRRGVTLGRLRVLVLLLTIAGLGALALWRAGR